MAKVWNQESQEILVAVSQRELYSGIM
jgi:hypothetical protein